MTAGIPGASKAFPKGKHGLGPFVHDEWVQERHHSFYGYPWAAGRQTLDGLLGLGLRPDHSFLDVGCGSLRNGVHLIRYLDKGRYAGLEADEYSLRAALEYEVPLNDLATKVPRFRLTRNFNVTHFVEKVDFALLFSVLQHLDDPKLAIRNVLSILKPSGKLVLKKWKKQGQPGPGYLGVMPNSTICTDCRTYAKEHPIIHQHETWGGHADPQQSHLYAAHTCVICTF